MYVAAFVALWLCCFVVVGEGPFIRPSVLVMASWIALGGKISLAPPALSSLYLALRRISTNPVGPSFEQTPLSIHYIIGWMHLYLKKAFEAKGKGDKLPSPKRFPMQLAMLSTMFRPAKVFSPETAHEFLENHNNIIWCPYSSRNLTGVDQLQRSFAISIRRGMLPWRFSAESTDLCAAEPYHPDRVARQFKLDQQVPYNPLQSLLTEADVGVAYAYWSHLLHPVQEDIQHALGTNYVGTASLAWTNWWRKFAHPHSTILNSLKSGNMCGKIPYDERKSMCAKRGKRFYPTHTLSEDDLFIIKEVLVSHQKAYIEKIEAQEKAFAYHWNPILHAFLSDDEPSMEPRRKRKKMDIVDCPSRDSSLHELGEDDALVSTEGASNLVSGEGTMTHISAPPVDISAITKPILDTIDLVLKNAFEALDTPTLTDSERREIFQAVRSVLPVGDTAPQIAAVRTGWEKFVSISDAVQEARKTVEDQSKQKSEFVTTAESKAESIEASLKTSAAEMSSVLEKHAEKKERVEALSAQLQEANAELLTAGERVKQLESDRSAKQAEAKKLHEDLLEANAKASEELEALKGNISTLENEAESIIGSLKDWRSKSN
uniref:Aminotransferase-like plant mobile domain-containing protein n=3 Tax=Aegilops tauschii subsp. strangulata TaxID=200361 RepID=A0A452XZV5_AEGTS